MPVGQQQPEPAERPDQNEQAEQPPTQVSRQPDQPMTISWSLSDQLRTVASRTGEVARVRRKSRQAGRTSPTNGPRTRAKETPARASDRRTDLSPIRLLRTAETVPIPISSRSGSGTSSSSSSSSTTVCSSTTEPLGMNH